MGGVILRLTGCLMLGLGMPSGRGVGHQEIVIGQSGAGQLKAHIDFTMPVELPVSPFPGFDGWADAMPGYASAFVDEPAEDLFQLPPGVNIVFILAAEDVGIHVWNDHGSAFLPVGGSFFLGMQYFDSHPVWNITNGVPGTSYALQMFIRDTTGTLTDSEPFSVVFTPHRPAAGDVDGNGAINAVDIGLFVGVLLGTDTTPVHVVASDANGDGVANGADMQPFVTAWLAAQP